MSKGSRKKKEKNIHVNKHAQYSKAEAVAAELDREDRKNQTPPPQHQVTTPYNRPAATEYRCQPYSQKMTIPEARDCSQYTPPDGCRSTYSTGLCTVIAKRIR